MAVASVLDNTEREENLESYVFYWPIVIFIWRRKWQIRSDLYFPVAQMVKTQPAM